MAESETIMPMVIVKAAFYEKCLAALHELESIKSAKAKEEQIGKGIVERQEPEIILSSPTPETKKTYDEKSNTQIMESIDKEIVPSNENKQSEPVTHTSVYVQNHPNWFYIGLED